MKEITWPVHKDSKKMDRAGRANSTKFWFLTHERMTDTIMFEMQHNNYIRAAGDLWCTSGCIPTGSPFSAQAADLHCLWGVYKNRHKFRALGELRIADEGFPYWVNASGIIPLCQFQDNILIATSYPDSPTERIVDTVCRILESSWDLAVLCDCRKQQTDPYRFTCHRHMCSAPGYSLIRGDLGDGTVHAQPSALIETWDLKLGPPLIAPERSHPAYLPGILLGVLSNTRQWCTTWAGEPLSLTVWLQGAALSGYNTKRLWKAGHSAVARGLSTSPHDMQRTVQYLYGVVHHLPMRRCCAISFCLKWLVKNAHWRGGQYSSWVIAKSLSPNGTTGAWSNDWYVLREVASQQPDCACHQSLEAPSPSGPHVCV